MHIDLTSFKHVVNFQPTDTHISFKILLNDRVSPQFLGKVLRSQLAVLEPHIAPYTLEDLEEWCKKPGFFEWLLLPDSFQVTLEKAKNDAANTLVDLLYPEEGCDTKLASIRLKAAELVLKSTMRREQKNTTNNIVKVNQQIPKHIASKSVEALTDELKYLRGE